MEPARNATLNAHHAADLFHRAHHATTDSTCQEQIAFHATDHAQHALKQAPNARHATSFSYTITNASNHAQLSVKATEQQTESLARNATSNTACNTTMPANARSAPMDSMSSLIPSH